MTSEKIEEDIGPQLIHGAIFASQAKTLGQRVDEVHRRFDPVRRQVQSCQASGAVGLGLCYNPPLLNGLCVCAVSVFGIGGHAVPAEQRPQLRSIHAVRIGGCLLHHNLGDVFGQGAGLVGEYLGPSNVDPAQLEQVTNVRETFPKIDGIVQLGFSRPPGEA
jgi:hypothetical protein